MLFCFDKLNNEQKAYFYRMKDLMGQAIWDFYHQNSPENIETETSISELDELPVAHLFRDFDEMNILEQKTLGMAKGKVLDVGSGAGSHALYLQNHRGQKVTALDISPKSVEVSKLRGLKNAICGDILDLYEEKFDTILLLMNGTGIFESIDKMDVYLKKLFSLLNEGGQILIDGTDILYMYEEEDGGYTIPAEHYYGELDYIVHYKGKSEKPIKWLYLDFETLKEAAKVNGLKAELVLEDGDSYLAKLVRF